LRKTVPEIPQPNTRPVFWADSIVGTPPYMSPEMIANQGSDPQSKQGYGKEVDWWSLGCVFFEMLTGTYPFEGQSEEEIFDRIRQYSENLSNCFELLRSAEHSEEVIDLVINGFLSDPSTRLGKDLKKIQSHAFFTDMDWERMREMPLDIEILMELKRENPEMDIEITPDEENEN